MRTTHKPVGNIHIRAMEILRLLLIGSCVHHAFNQPNRWCDPKFECNGKKHTMCEYKEEKDKGDCKGIVNGMTPESKERLLGLHNYVRNYMAAGNVPGWPEAANMRQITWDDECAEIALRWAFQCQAGHDACRVTEIFTKDVGQNYGIIESVNTFDDGVYKIYRNWLSEITEAPSKIVKKFVFKSKYGHFSQLVWAETYKMGCGMTNFTTDTGFTTYKNVIVCNYGPAGNVNDQPMWIYGPVGSKCGGGSRTDDNSSYRNLCALQTDPNNENPVPIEIPSGERSRIKFTSVPFLACALLAII